MEKRETFFAAVSIFLITVLGVLMYSGRLVVPEWFLWSIIIASGNLIRTKVFHNKEVEEISLVMTLILIAIQTLGWPEIAIATIFGVGIGEVFHRRPWKKKVYNIVAISTAAIITEILFTYTDIIPLKTILGTAIVFDALLYTFLVPIWIRVAKQSIKEIHESYWMTFYTVPASAVLAWIVLQSVAMFGSYGIAAVAVAFIILLKPRYVIQ